jgi:hypothetical protein
MTIIVFLYTLSLEGVPEGIKGQGKNPLIPTFSPEGRRSFGMQSNHPAHA